MVNYYVIPCTGSLWLMVKTSYRCWSFYDKMLNISPQLQYTYVPLITMLLLSWKIKSAIPNHYHDIHFRIHKALNHVSDPNEVCLQHLKKGSIPLCFQNNLV